MNVRSSLPPLADALAGCAVRRLPNAPHHARRLLAPRHADGAARDVQTAGHLLDWRRRIRGADRRHCAPRIQSSATPFSVPTSFRRRCRESASCARSCTRCCTSRRTGRRSRTPSPPRRGRRGHRSPTRSSSSRRQGDQTFSTQRRPRSGTTTAKTSTWSIQRRRRAAFRCAHGRADWLRLMLRSLTATALDAAGASLATLGVAVAREQQLFPAELAPDGTARAQPQDVGEVAAAVGPRPF